jgi:putative ABC transport system substrate-binding protein
VNRRTFIAALGGAVAWPLVARAQQVMPVVGYVGVGRGSDDTDDYTSFALGLNEAGFFNQQNVIIDRREVSNVDQLQAAAIELVANKVAVICGPSQAIIAAKAATATIPLVFIGGRDPVAAGLVSSFNQPSGNVTGVDLEAGDLPAKQIELLHELMPSVIKIGLLYSPGFTDSEPGTKLALDTAKGLGITVLVNKATAANDLESSFDHFAQEGARTVQVVGNVFLGSYRGRLAELAVQRRLPMVGNSRRYAIAGALMSYGTDTAAMIRQAGTYVGRILKGEKPADLPVLQPTKYDLVINLKTAKLVGINVPAMLLARADEVIE